MQFKILTQQNAKESVYLFKHLTFLIRIKLLILGVRTDISPMKKNYHKGLLFIILILSAILLMPGCATSKKNSYLSKKAKAASYINTTQLGRNKYFFSPKYQKKLFKYKRR